MSSLKDDSTHSPQLDITQVRHRLTEAFSRISPTPWSEPIIHAIEVALASKEPSNE